MEPFHGFLYVLKLSFQFFYSNISLISRNISTYPFLPSTMPLLFQLAEYQTQLYYSTLIFKNQKRKKKIHSSRATQELLKTSIDKKKKKRKKIPRWTIKVHYLRFVLFHNSLSIFEEEKKKIYRIKSFIVTRTITDRQETEVDSREREREKKNPSNIPCSEWTLKRRRTGGHSYLNFQRRCYGSFAISPAEIPPSPSPSPSPHSYLVRADRPTRGSTEPLTIDLPPSTSV